MFLSKFPDIYRPQTKLWEGNVFTPVCQSFYSQGGSLYDGTSCLTETPPRDRDPPPPCAVKSGRYASYWNAFLFLLFFKSLWSNVNYYYHLLPKTPFLKTQTQTLHANVAKSTRTTKQLNHIIHLFHDHLITVITQQ